MSEKDDMPWSAGRVFTLPAPMFFASCAYPARKIEESAMKFIPFPPTLVRISAETGRRLQSSDIDDAGQRRPRGPLPHPYVARDIAAYRWPDGRVGIAHDIYAAEHPEGAEPGLARVRFGIRHHPNDTSSYEAQIISFKSDRELEDGGLRIDRTAAGFLRIGADIHLVVARDEEDLAEMSRSFPEGSRLLRRTVTLVGEGDGPPDRFLAVTAMPSGRWHGAGSEIFGARDGTALHEAATRRYAFVSPGRDLPDFIDALRRHGEPIGWAIRDGSRDEVMRELERHLGLHEDRSPTPF